MKKNLFDDIHDKLMGFQYDTCLNSMERADKPQRYLNYGYAEHSGLSLEEKQENLCREVFRLADIQPEDTVADVGFGSGEQDFLLARLHPFRKLYGFNISEKQVAHASERATREGMSERMSFHCSPAEDMNILPDGSVDKIMAIECAFHFQRPLFYREAARVLREGGRLALADICFDERLGFMTNLSPGTRRVGTLTGNQSAWEEHFQTVSITDIRDKVLPGAKESVSHCFSIKDFGIVEMLAWSSLGLSIQFIVAGMASGLIRYDLIVLEK